jgi:hypothetical protein
MTLRLNLFLSLVLAGLLVWSGTAAHAAAPSATTVILPTEPVMLPTEPVILPTQPVILPIQPGVPNTEPVVPNSEPAGPAKRRHHRQRTNPSD